LGDWEQSQERFIACRAVAEYLRSLRLLAPLGAVPRAPMPAAHQATQGNWTIWYRRAVTRSLGLTPGRLDSDAVSAAAVFLRAETVGQVRYLEGHAARFAAMAKRLQRIGVGLFIAGIVFEVTQGALLLVGIGGPSADWLGGLSLVLPALAPVFLGLLAFGEYSRLAARYRAVAAELKAQLVALDHMETGRRVGVLSIGRHICEVMLAESADWQLLIRATTLSTY
jgi:hypothetical protein